MLAIQHISIKYFDSGFENSHRKKVELFLQCFDAIKPVFDMQAAKFSTRKAVFLLGCCRPSDEFHKSCTKLLFLLWKNVRAI